MSEILQVEHFEALVGKIARFEGTAHAFPLERIICNDDKVQKGATRRQFTLIFRGPKDKNAMPEGLYECAFEGGPTYSLYVMPIFTPQPERQDYQSVFN
jgi:hypothetical protein